MCAFLGLWLPESSKGKVLSLKRVDQNECIRSAADPGLRNTPKYAQDPQSISRISAIAPEF